MNNRPLFYNENDKYSHTVQAHCPKCKATLIHYKQEKCQECGLKLEWESDEE